MLKTMYLNLSLGIGITTFCLTQYVGYIGTYSYLKGDIKQKTLVFSSLIPHSLMYGTAIGISWPILLTYSGYHIIKENMK